MGPPHHFFDPTASLNFSVSAAAARYPCCLTPLGIVKRRQLLKTAQCRVSNPDAGVAKELTTRSSIMLSNEQQSVSLLLPLLQWLYQIHNMWYTENYRYISVVTCDQHTLMRDQVAQPMLVAAPLRLDNRRRSSTGLPPQEQCPKHFPGALLSRFPSLARSSHFPVRTRLFGM
jgi:hypothetical protein